MDLCKFNMPAPKFPDRGNFPLINLTRALSETITVGKHLEPEPTILLLVATVQEQTLSIQCNGLWLAQFVAKRKMSYEFG